MVLERQPTGTRVLDVLDRILDKGIVMDAWIQFQLIGLDLITIDARVVVASIQTYLDHAEALRRSGRALLLEGDSVRRTAGSRAKRNRRRAA